MGGMTLPYDTARCAGRIYMSPINGDIMHVDCIHCLRRTSPGRDQWQSHIAPHDGEGPCPMRIGPREDQQ